MAISSKVKAVLNIKGKDHKALATHLGLSSQALSNKFYRDSFSYNEVAKIADILNCDVKIITRDTGKEFF